MPNASLVSFQNHRIGTLSGKHEAPHFRYEVDSPWVLDGVNITIPRYGHTAIVGPSGAGKTTIFAILLKFMKPNHGSIILDGRPFEKWTIADIRSRLAYVEQDTPIIPGTVRDNLAYGAPEASDASLWYALEVVRLDDRIRSLRDGVDADISENTLSGGERQRIAVARAIIADPELLLLDEVTAQLDGLSEVAVSEGIRRQAARGAVVTIAHRLSTVMDADQIIVLDAGRVRATGTHNELLTNDALYASLVDALRIASDGRRERVAE
ncbi:ATP-binding cassette domain-containing protein [Haloactinospora alba]|uniref:ATP-binding cassette domain-containing protein n=1 Tax=Haloactinospora alba TaxID=405555 RepID=UPI001B866DB6|nr:ATP-binding cassette domain-containing protein [Haloactinospora alba]